MIKQHWVTIAPKFILFLLIFLSSPFLFAEEPPPNLELPINYLFRDSFYAPPSLKLKYDIYETTGFLLIRDKKRGGNSEFAIITNFDSPMVESRVLKNIRSMDAVSTFLEKNTRKIIFERIPIKEIPLVSKGGATISFFWVGQRAFNSLETAKAKIIEVKTAIEASGGNFDRSLQLINEFFPEEPAPTPQQVQANYLAEEEMALQILDWLDVGEINNYGPLGLIPGHALGVATGEPLLWQSFGESTFRWTNLDRAGFNDQVGYYTNRVVLKGIRFIGEPTIDPYVEITAALESQGANFPKHLDLIGGLEYRPFGRVEFFENFNFQSLHLLKFIRNYRFYVQYLERKNLSDEIGGSPDTDLHAGVDVFYEWGVELPLPWVVPQREGIIDYIHDYVWGEYFGNYNWRKTNFSSVDGYHAWIYNSSLMVGIKWPSIPLPNNPINPEFLLMPYLRLEHITVPRRSELSFDNRIFVAAGIRWMPFRSYQFEHNEWLFKTKLFAEYVGVGGVHHPGGANPDDVPNRDWRAGINVSFKRY